MRPDCMLTFMHHGNFLKKVSTLHIVQVRFVKKMCRSDLARLGQHYLELGFQ